MKIFQKWADFSLRTRLCVLLMSMFVAALVVGSTLLYLFSATQLIDETEPAAKSAALVARALNSALAASSTPQSTLDAFATSLAAAGSEALTFQAVGDPPKPPIHRSQQHQVPAWFAAILPSSEIVEQHPIMIGDTRVGDLIYDPDISADIFEKWIGFLALTTAALSLTTLTFLIAYFTVGTALKPLRELARAVSRLREGEYGIAIIPYGPPEVRQSCKEVNELARNLDGLSQRNQTLLGRMISLQDDERKELARELHDELGPLLFALRANAIAMDHNASDIVGGPNSLPRLMLQSIETIQQTNRRILDRLRPLYIEELGLEASIKALVRTTASHQPGVKVAVDIGRDLDAIEGKIAQTAFRIVQEALTNALRHAQASTLSIGVRRSSNQLTVEIIDNGRGPPSEIIFGRGLTGMRERALSLGGAFLFSHDGGYTRALCTLPIIASTKADGRDA